MIVVEIGFVTLGVVTVKLACSCPPEIVTDVGMVRPDSFELRLTLSPPEGAWPLRLTVPVAEAPAKTCEGSSVSDAKVAGFIVSVPVSETPATEAVTLAVVVAAPPAVGTVNVAESLPAATVTVAGT